VAIRFQIPKSAFLVRIATSKWGKILLGSALGLTLISFSVLIYFYVHYAKLIDEKLKAGPFPNTALLYAAPRGIQIGDELTAGETATLLRKAGYSEGRANPIGWYLLRPDAIEIHPEADSYFSQEGAVIKFNGKKVSQIIALRDNVDVNHYQIEPELITSLFDQKREKRRIVQFDDIPETMRHAVLSAEDKRFFDHAGFDPIRIVGALWYDIRKGSARQGASTLTMQVARTLWLTNKRTWDRKIPEALITLHLEQKLTKKEIFQYYFNSIYVGQHGSFSIHGFGEASQAYFGKELGSLTLAESALLAGLPQVPVSPIKNPDRAKKRRNIVLGMMKDNGYINQQQYDEACAAPVRVVTKESESSEAPYFVDLVSDQLAAKLGPEYMGKPYKIYTSLDIELQQDANAAVKVAMAEVDKAMASRFKGYPNAEHPLVQVALVALDPHSGEVRALLGGRDYGQTQLNRAIAKRQPGSSFKPFVYAAALATVLDGESKPVTPLSTYVDEQTTFWYDGKPYEPGNFHDTYSGTVTLRHALSKSLNIPTVKIAEEIGYRRVVQLARNAGMNSDIRATPAVALGAYEVTPLEVAGAYTVFSNYGKFMAPNFFLDVRDPDGERIDVSKQGRHVLDSRVAYMMTNLMQEVTRTGTGAGIRSRGFWQPAAGKTGSSRDGWFVGYTSKLLCAVWIGFDDNKDIGLEGSRTALPVWTEFMKRAHTHRQYRNVTEFAPPDGVLTVEIDPATGHLAAANCPLRRTEVFIAGTQPIDICRTHGGGAATQIATWDAAPAPAPVADPGAAAPGAGPQPAAPNQDGQSPSNVQKREVRQARSIPVTPVPQPPQSQQPSSPPRSKGLMDRIRSIFK
jgi:penicillin-binding protein 1B